MNHKYFKNTWRHRTWVYYYNNPNILFTGYRGELEDWESGTTLVQKIHEYGDGNIKDFGGRAIVLLRNPYRAILSYHNFLFGGHRGYAPISNYRRKGKMDYICNLTIRTLN